MARKKTPPRGAAAQDAQVRQFVEDVGLYMENSGLPRMAGRLLGWLLICDPPAQSSAQLVEALGASKGSISTNTRLLVQIDLIEKVAVPGEREFYFRVRPHAWDQTIESRLAALRAFCDLCTQGLEILEGEDAERRERLEDVRDFYAFLGQEFLLVLRHWQEREQRRRRERE
jgi:DNA-binding transcriptional regulator GbsR (MarR family)